MSVPATCTRCGFRFTSRALRIRNAINITIRDIGETCPRCGGLAKLQDGTYDFVGEVLAAVRAPGVMRQDVLAFQGVARAVQEGVLSFEDASEQLAQINSAFATLWKWMNDNGAAITVVLTVIALYITSDAVSGANATKDL